MFYLDINLLFLELICVLYSRLVVNLEIQWHKIYYCPLYLFIFSRQSFALVTQAGIIWVCNGIISAHRNLCLLGSGNSPASASRAAGITGMCHHAQLSFCIFSRDSVLPCCRMVSISWPRDPPASAFLSAGITGLSHRAQPQIFIYGFPEVAQEEMGLP